MRINNRRITVHYALIQALYWISYCLMINFAGVFLLDKGLTSGEIGLVLGLSYLFSACLQPAAGVAFSRAKLRLNQCALGVYMLIAALSLSLFLAPSGKVLLEIRVIALFTLQSMMQPTINSLSRGFEPGGVKLSFGLARGIGSLAFSVACLAAGQLLRHMAPSVLPCLYFVTASMLAVALMAYRVSGERQVDEDSGENSSYGEMLRSHSHFLFFLLGVTGLFITHEFIESFLIQILMSIGGDSANLGIATMLSSMTELPAMVLYARYSRKEKRSYALMAVAGWLWLVKDILTMLVRTPQALYAVQLMHFATNAIYVPVMMDYVSRTLPRRMFIRAVSLAGTANTLGCLLGSILGGWLLDRMAVRSALTAMLIFALAGAVCMTIGIRQVKPEVSPDLNGD